MIETIQGLLIIGLSLLIAVFSACDSALSAFDQARLLELKEEGNPKAQKLMRLCKNLDRLKTTLVTTTWSMVILASILMAEFSDRYQPAWPYLLGFGLLEFIFCILTPRIFGNARPLKTLFSHVKGLTIIVALLRPLTYLFRRWKSLLNVVFNLKTKSVMTEDRLLYYLDEANKEGEINEDEKDLIQSAIEFEDLDVEDVLTPRVDLVAVEVDEAIENIEKKFEDSGFSRLPVYVKEIDKITGFIHEKDFYREVRLNGQPISTIIKPVIFISLHTSVSSLLRQLQVGKTHIAIVIDEYGGVSGIVTLEDIIEELVGEIWDEHDKVIEYIQKLADNVYQINCELSLQKFFDEFDIRADADDYDSTLVNGWVIAELGKFPKVGDTFEFENLRIRVLNVSNKKVIDIIVDVKQEEKDEDE